MVAALLEAVMITIRDLKRDKMLRRVAGGLLTAALAFDAIVVVIQLSQL